MGQLVPLRRVPVPAAAAAVPVASFGSPSAGNASFSEATDISVETEGRTSVEADE
jgi:hypothetical protein